MDAAARDAVRDRSHKTLHRTKDAYCKAFDTAGDAGHERIGTTSDTIQCMLWLVTRDAHSALALELSIKSSHSET